MSYYAVIDYSDKSKNICAGSSINLRIFYYQGKSLVGVEMYSPEKIEQLKKMRIPIITKYRYDVPMECLKRPKRKIYFGVIRI